MSISWSQFERYLKGEHLQGKRAIVTIAKLQMETLHPSPTRAEDKPVLYFQGRQKGLILSPSNIRTLATLFGDDAEACIGKRIALEAVPMRVAGRDTLPVRIFPATQEAEKEQPIESNE